MNSDIIAVTFFLLLLICFVSILLLLIVVLYKCFQSKKNDETGNGFCENCLTDNVETSSPGDQEKALREIVKPGILVDRRSKEMAAAYLQNQEDREGQVEDKTEEMQPPEDAEESQQGAYLQKAHSSVSKIPSVTATNKRPLKGVTFSREVIVVDLGEAYPTPQSHIQEHKERK